MYKWYIDNFCCLKQIFFNEPNEELIHLKGTTGKVGGELVVTSLTFYSNQRVYGPFGCVRNIEFQSSPNGKVNGFYGKAGICLDQIGFITKFSYNECIGEVVTQGPWGGLQGIAFYDGKGELLDINVCYNKSQILSLQMTYGHNGTSYKGEKHGASGGERTKVQIILFLCIVPC